MADALTPTQRRDRLVAAIKTKSSTVVELAALLDCEPRVIRSDASRCMELLLMHSTKEKGDAARVKGGTCIAIYHFGPAPAISTRAEKRASVTTIRQVRRSKYPAIKVKHGCEVHALFWHKVAA